MNDLIRIHPKDMVAVALRPLPAGYEAEVEGARVCLTEDVPMGHKVALRAIEKGEPIIKYGFPIGTATQDIPAGGHVHVSNLRTLLSGELEYAWNPTHPALDAAEPIPFMGYRREDGRVGKGIDGVYAFRHPYGCSQMGDDQDNTRQLLADLCGHPNAGGVLLLGLGCENSPIELILKHMDEGEHPRLRTLVSQQVDDEIEAGEALLNELADRMAKEERVPCDTRDLVIGLKCGGSDGLSGITANPTIGGFSDRLIARGGATILTEVPEMFGAETILMNRCEDEDTFERTVSLINNFKRYFEASGQPVYENPSPGNKAGGISTLEDKALGCTQKSGDAPVADVLTYGQRVTKKGLNLLSAPGNDLVASTALAAAGAQVVLFSTGRGTPFASPVPTVKIASNSDLAGRKKNWIDFNAGALLDGKTLPQLSDELLALVLAIAGGQETKSETCGYRDLAIFKNGVTL